MTLSEREQRMLTAIEKDRAAAEPRLLVLRRRLVASPDAAQRRERAWLTAIFVSLLSGIALLVAVLVLAAVGLICAGAPLAQFGPAACGYLYRKTHRASLGNPRTGAADCPRAVGSGAAADPV